jgi:WhiB family redox-sensing transcriptional regulator
MFSTVADDFDGLKWLDNAACADLDLDDFFVAAGHTISDAVLNICKSCPVRRECVEHVYRRDLDSGYFGGLSPSQRRSMSLQEALAFIEGDRPAQG